ncbi:MAG: hypothetical protein M1838_005024 [Thelocarpon superellum]|nr:MAG: hypothetical protein M1838_005024 [Thelocarpon superellum]
MANTDAYIHRPLFSMRDPSQDVAEPDYADPIILRSDPSEDKAYWVSYLRRVWPEKCRQVKLPLDMNAYFDKQDLHLHGAGFLWSVLWELIAENAAHKEHLVGFAYQWSEGNPRRFKEVTAECTPNVLFRKEELEMWGSDFLAEVLTELKFIKEHRPVSPRPPPFYPPQIPNELPPMGFAPGHLPPYDAMFAGFVDPSFCARGPPSLMSEHVHNAPFAGYYAPPARLYPCLPMAAPAPQVQHVQWSQGPAAPPAGPPAYQPVAVAYDNHYPVTEQAQQRGPFQGDAHAYFGPAVHPARAVPAAARLPTPPFRGPPVGVGPHGPPRAHVGSIHQGDPRTPSSIAHINYGPQPGHPSPSMDYHRPAASLRTQPVEVPSHKIHRYPVARGSAPMNQAPRMREMSDVRHAGQGAHRMLPARPVMARPPHNKDAVAEPGRTGRDSGYMTRVPSGDQAQPPYHPALMVDDSATALWVGGVAQEVTEHDILEAFAPFGHIEKVHLPRVAPEGPHDGQVHRGFAFIQYATTSFSSELELTRASYTNPVDAETARLEMNHSILNGSSLSVQRQNPKSRVPLPRLPGTTPPRSRAFAPSSMRGRIECPMKVVDAGAGQDLEHRNEISARTPAMKPSGPSCSTANIAQPTHAAGHGNEDSVQQAVLVTSVPATALRTMPEALVTGHRNDPTVDAQYNKQSTTDRTSQWAAHPYAGLHGMTDPFVHPLSLVDSNVAHIGHPRGCSPHTSIGPVGPVTSHGPVHGRAPSLNSPGVYTPQDARSGAHPARVFHEPGKPHIARAHLPPTLARGASAQTASTGEALPLGEASVGPGLPVNVVRDNGPGVKADPLPKRQAQPQVPEGAFQGVTPSYVPRGTPQGPSVEPKRGKGSRKASRRSSPVRGEEAATPEPEVTKGKYRAGKAPKIARKSVGRAPSGAVDLGNGQLMPTSNAHGALNDSSAHERKYDGATRHELKLAESEAPGADRDGSIGHATQLVQVEPAVTTSAAAEKPPPLAISTPEEHPSALAESEEETTTTPDENNSPPKETSPATDSPMQDSRLEVSLVQKPSPPTPTSSRETSSLSTSPEKTSKGEKSPTTKESSSEKKSSGGKKSPGGKRSPAKKSSTSKAQPSQEATPAETKVVSNATPPVVQTVSNLASIATPPVDQALSSEKNLPPKEALSSEPKSPITNVSLETQVAVGKESPVSNASPREEPSPPTISLEEISPTKETIVQIEAKTGDTCSVSLSPQQPMEPGSGKSAIPSPLASSLASPTSDDSPPRSQNVWTSEPRWKNHRLRPVGNMPLPGLASVDAFPDLIVAAKTKTKRNRGSASTGSSNPSPTKSAVSPTNTSEVESETAASEEVITPGAQAQVVPVSTTWSQVASRAARLPSPPAPVKAKTSPPAKNETAATRPQHRKQSSVSSSSSSSRGR